MNNNRHSSHHKSILRASADHSSHRMSKEYLEPSKYDMKLSTRVTYEDLYEWLCEIEWIRPAAGNNYIEENDKFMNNQKKRWFSRDETFDGEMSSSNRNFHPGSGRSMKRHRQHKS